MKPTRANLKKPETWPKGWKLHKGFPVGDKDVLVHMHRGSWAAFDFLEDGDYWLPMPPPPRSRKWNTL